MARDLGPSRHWFVVLGCLALACSPASARERLRGALLELSTRATSRGEEPPAPPTARERELANELALERAKRCDLERALDELKAASELTAERTDLRLLPAEAFPLAGPGEMVRRLLLGRGSREGVAAGAPVLAGSALVGFVAQAVKEKCEVRLLTDPTFRLRATAPRAGVDGILAGSGAATLVFTPAPSGIPGGSGGRVGPPELDDPGRALQAGDVLVVSRASTICSVPAVLGTIRDVERVPGEASSRAVVVPAAPVARLTRAVVVLGEPGLARAEGSK